MLAAEQLNVKLALEPLIDTVPAVLLVSDDELTTMAEPDATLPPIAMVPPFEENTDDESKERTRPECVRADDRKTP